MQGSCKRAVSRGRDIVRVIHETTPRSLCCQEVSITVGAFHFLTAVDKGPGWPKMVPDSRPVNAYVE